MSSFRVQLVDFQSTTELKAARNKSVSFCKLFMFEIIKKYPKFLLRSILLLVKFSAMCKRRKNGILVCAKYVGNGGLGHFSLDALSRISEITCICAYCNKAEKTDAIRDWNVYKTSTDLFLLTRRYAATFPWPFSSAMSSGKEDSSL